MAAVSIPLDQTFYARPALVVARALLGQRLVRVLPASPVGQAVSSAIRLSGLIVETEAYRGEEDLGCHAKAGRTPRTQVMYGPPGHAYVYFTYGMHWMLNFVVEEEGFPAAILIRAMRVDEGQERVAARRAGQPPERWTDGPGKLCQALAIDRMLNGADVCSTQAGLWVEAGEAVPDASVTIGPRVGLNNTPEPWKSIPWRFRIKMH